jgi:hypothetical protein
LPPEFGIREHLRGVSLVCGPQHVRGQGPQRIGQVSRLLRGVRQLPKMAAMSAQFKGRPVHPLHPLELDEPEVGSNPTGAVA